MIHKKSTALQLPEKYLSGGLKPASRRQHHLYSFQSCTGYTRNILIMFRYSQQLSSTLVSAYILAYFVNNMNQDQSKTASTGN